MELYHIHKSNKHDLKWCEGNELIVGNTFSNGMNERQNRFSTLSGSMNFHDCLTDIMLNKPNFTKDDYELIKYILETGFEISYYANMFKREQALENCRLNFYPELPSRLHSVFLTDAQGLEHWIKIIPEDPNFSVYKVSASDIFKTNEYLLPNETLNYIDTYNSAHKYWRPKLKNVPSETVEYLANGKIKILKRVI